jgi:hypothetical protein
MPCRINSPVVLGLSSVVALCLEGFAGLEQARKIQAPFDTFVCANKSFNACATQVGQGGLNEIFRTQGQPVSTTVVQTSSATNGVTPPKRSLEAQSAEAH